jgi:23S rRNA (cytidine1920-2'-O)/16S rRNA (cytidine1409-2'-O)-methyltransferase
VAEAVRNIGAPPPAVLGFASSGLPGPKGNRETFVHLAEADRAGALGTPAIEAAAREVEP